MNPPTIYAAIPLAGVLVLSILVLLALRYSRQPRLRRAFTLVNLATAAWHLDIFLLTVIRERETALLVDRLFQPAMALIPLLWINFATLLLGSPRRRLLLGLFGAGTLPLLLAAPTPLFIADMARRHYGWYGVAGPLYPGAILLHLLTLLTALVFLVKRYRDVRADQGRRQQSLYYLAATLILGLISMDNYLPLYGGDNYPLGSVALLLYIVFVSFAVVRYRLLDFRTLFRQSLVYTSATAVLTAAYLAGVLLLEKALRSLVLAESAMVPLVPALVAAFLFQWIRNLVQRRVDRRWGPAARWEEVMGRFTAGIAATSDRRELARLFCDTVRETFHADRAAFFRHDALTGAWRAEHVTGFTEEEVAGLRGEHLPRLRGDDPGRVVALCRRGGREEGDPPPRGEELLLVRVAGKGTLGGAAVLGGKADGMRYGGEERAFLSLLAGTLANALDATEYYRRWRREERYTAMGRASSTISHQLRNPLNVIRGASHLLAGGQETAEASRLAGIIREEVDRATSFMERILAASRIPRVHRSPGDLGAWLEGFLERWRRDHDGVEVAYRPPPGPVVVPFDPILLEQMVANLLGNAAEAMGGRGALTAAVGLQSPRPGREGRASAVIAIGDRGPGIPAERLETVFEPFFSTKSGGTGLGLAIVDGIVLAHGGSREVDSVPGQGTTFRVILPAGGEGALPAAGEGVLP